MVRGLVGAGQAQHLRAKLPQVALDLLLLRALDVVLGRVLQVSLDLRQRQEGGRQEEKQEVEGLLLLFFSHLVLRFTPTV